jgi:hypothetical protein
MGDRFGNSGRRGQGGFDVDDEIHYPTRPVDKDKAEAEVVINIKKATSPEETAPKQKHVRSASPPSHLPISVLILRRMYRVYMGLPLLNFLLEWTAGSANLGR